MPNLALITVLEPHGTRQWRSCAKLWISSLLRHQWGGRIHLQRNFAEPLFAVERADLGEAEAAALARQLHTKTADWAQASRLNQLQAAETIPPGEEFDW